MLSVKRTTDHPGTCAPPPTVKCNHVPNRPGEAPQRFLDPRLLFDTVARGWPEAANVKHTILLAGSGQYHNRAPEVMVVLPLLQLDITNCPPTQEPRNGFCTSDRTIGAVFNRSIASPVVPGN